MIIILGFYLLNSICVTAQVPVSKEPRHHVVFENEKVRILNVLIPPGDTTQYHVHSTPSVFILFTKTRTGSQLLNNEARYSTSAAGNVYFENLNAPHTRIHRVWNTDTAVFHVMDIELLTKKPDSKLEPLTIANARLRFDTPWVKAYKVTLAVNEALDIKKQASDFIAVAIDNAKIKLSQNGKETTSFLKPGQFYWISANQVFSLINSSDAPAHFVLLDVK